VLGEAGIPPVADEERHETRQRADVVVRVDRVVQRVAEQRPKIMRETIGKDAFALDQAGIAIGRFLAGAAAVEQHQRTCPAARGGWPSTGRQCLRPEQRRLSSYPFLHSRLSRASYFFSLVMICSRNPSISAETTKARCMIVAHISCSLV
jgi:hypothetical protein